MSSKNGDLYHQLYLAYKSNHSFKSAALCRCGKDLNQNSVKVIVNFMLRLEN